MSDIAIRVEVLGKQYRIGRKQERYKSLRDTLTDAFVAPFRRANKLLRGQATGAAELDETIWALKDVSFEIKRGEVIGIVGRNGSGKTTLLRILCRITEPTEGRGEIYGRVGALLEVGTGFHPELTGRENIYLNGAILGMRKEEINRKFDEIVDFAEVEKFIDTPVKHYSTGMYLRLAFAVAAHLEPEILLVDEVLAVGDAAFQKKCLGKMGDVAKEGRTVLFVSHNMGAVRNLCNRGFWVEKGQIVLDSDSDNVVNTYLESTLARADEGPILLEERTDRTGDGRVRFISFVARLAGGSDYDLPHTGKDMELILGYRSSRGGCIAALTVTVGINNMQGYPLMYVGNRYVNMQLVDLPPEGELVCRIPALPLQPGYYYATLSCNANGVSSDKLREAVRFEVLPDSFCGIFTLPPKKHGDFLTNHKWTLQP